MKAVSWKMVTGFVNGGAAAALRATRLRKVCVNGHGTYNRRWRVQRNGAARCNANGEDVERITVAWVEKIVVGLHLCPFAEDVVKNDKLRVKVCEATSACGVKQCVMSEIDHLLGTSREIVRTTLIVARQFGGEFVRFQEFCEDLEKQVENDDALVDQVVVAWFHPEFRWGGVDLEDAIHFDKRAPYATINLLRADELDEYIEKGKTQHILEMNQKTLRRMGVERMNQLYDKIGFFQK